MSRYEYRVVWRRTPTWDGWGGSRHYVIFQTREAAIRKALRLQGRWGESRGEDPNDYACCPGLECPCRGETWAELDARFSDELRPLEQLRIDYRLVEEWARFRTIQEAPVPMVAEV